MVEVKISDRDAQVLEKWRKKRSTLVLNLADRHPELAMWLADNIMHEPNSETLHSLLSQFQLENLGDID